MYSLIETNKGVIAVLQITKCGSQTLRSAEYGSSVDPVNTDKIAFIRDPIDRLVSFYSFQRQFECFPPNMPESLTWADFIDWVLDGDDLDTHIHPIAKFIDDYPVDRIYHLSQMTGVLRLQCERQHVTNKLLVDTSYRAKELKIKYTDDYDLLNRLEW